MPEIDHDSLTFCFSAMVKETDKSNLELEIEPSPGAELEFRSLELRRK
jgi:Zn finger protein HypA/HybF involved in hydrogenase expression